MKHIAIIQTGGTFSMLPNQDGKETLISTRNQKVRLDIPELPELADIEHFDLMRTDSSEMNPELWQTISDKVYELYSDFDGFVIIHGTDTMAYTACALSFAFHNLNKPIILTGSQIPIANVRSDARFNLINAVEMATYPIFEVALCFNDHLFRGNRCTKMNIEDFDAFASPNFPPLAEIGIRIQLNKQHGLSFPSRSMKYKPGWDTRILTLKAWPGLRADPAQLLTDEVRAVLIEAYGCGNIPIKGPWTLKPLIEKAIERDLPVVITSQAVFDRVDLSKYENGQFAKDLGCISADDMTFEASLVKMMWVLANRETELSFREQFMNNIAGERSP